ncbi:DUF2917 domain-containing protein [Piscinibacter sakaiensis]|uniref:DUF2917 domain-containing protein n=1 Tax=Piscinibacter sakaiensis TaxID=1547922 RepID=UPI003AAB8CCD
MASTIHNPQASFINLDHDQLLVLSDRRGSRVEVVFGGVWLTEENPRADQFIEGGQAWQISRRGRVVAAAIGRTGVRISAPAGLAARWRALLGSLARHRPALAARGVATLLAVVIGIGLAELTSRGFHGGAGPMHALIALPDGALSKPV